jgi:hypothetical protein
MRSKMFAVLLLAALAAGCAHQNQMPSGRIEDVVKARATVTAIDMPNRVVTLKGEKGDVIVLEVPEAVRNLAQVRVGDEVITSYTEAVAWQVKPAGQGTPGMSSKDSMTTAEPGARPGATVGRTVNVTATITAIDLANGTVTLTGPGGNSQVIKARDPANLKKVKVGDLVDITYTEAVAISVQPVAK